MDKAAAELLVLDLRPFRHFFRHAYGVELKPDSSPTPGPTSLPGRNGYISFPCTGNVQGVAGRLVGGIGLTVTVLLLLGCSDAVSGCHHCTTQAIAYGRVTDAGGGPVEGIGVEVFFSAAVCSDATRVVHGGSLNGLPVTDSTGRYRWVVISSFAPFIAACATVTGNSLADSRWTTVELEVPTSLEFREEGMELDSARFDVVLESSAGG